MCAGVPTIEMKTFHGLLVRHNTRLCCIPQRLSKFVVKKKETISAVIEEKAIEGSLTLNIAMLILYVTWLLNCLIALLM
jgi:hypothetical protein